MELPSSMRMQAALLLGLLSVCFCDEECSADECPASESSTKSPDEVLLAPFTVMSYNIRYDSFQNFEPMLESPSPESWLSRRVRFADVIKSYSPDIVGLQEVQAWQGNDLACLLGYHWVGDGRETPNAEGGVKAAALKAGAVAIAAGVALAAVAAAIAWVWGRWRGTRSEGRKATATEEQTGEAEGNKKTGGGEEPSRKKGAEKSAEAESSASLVASSASSKPSNPPVRPPAPISVPVPVPAPTPSSFVPQRLAAYFVALLHVVVMSVYAADAVFTNYRSVKSCSRLLSSYAIGFLTLVVVIVSTSLCTSALFFHLIFRRSASPFKLPGPLSSSIVLLLWCLYCVFFVGLTLAHLIILPFWSPFPSSGKGNEYSPIFFDPSKLVPTSSPHTTWLNANRTPGLIASEWGAACPRVLTSCTFSRLNDPAAPSFLFLNTHLDHVGENARVEGIKLIASILTEERGQRQLPAIITGDFNTYVATPTWYALNGTMQDTFFSSETPHVGPLQSYNFFYDWQECGRSIDWIFVTRGGFKVKTHESKFYEGKVSDHNPMIATLEFLGEGETIPMVAGAGGKEDWTRPFGDCKRRGLR